jgi:hypothetical protein
LLNWLNPLDDLTNFLAGFGGGVSLGLTDWIREEWTEKVWEDHDVVDPCSGAYMAGKFVGYLWFTAINIEGARTGYEFKFGKNWRFAPWGNRTDHKYGERPHYHHRHSPGPDGEPPSGGSIGRHRPWEAPPEGVPWWRRF